MCNGYTKEGEKIESYKMLNKTIHGRKIAKDKKRNKEQEQQVEMSNKCGRY